MGLLGLGPTFTSFGISGPHASALEREHEAAPSQNLILAYLLASKLA